MGTLLTHLHCIAYDIVGCCLAIKVFIDKLLVTQGVLVVRVYANDERGSWANKIVARPCIIGVHSTVHMHLIKSR